MCNYRCQYCSVSKVHVIRIRPLYLLQCTSHPFIWSSSQRGDTALMVAEESPNSNPSTIQLLKQATESHVSPYLNNAYTDHECFSLVVPNEWKHRGCWCLGEVTEAIRHEATCLSLLSSARYLLLSSSIIIVQKVGNDRPWSLLTKVQSP